MITLSHLKHVPEGDLFATPGHKQPETKGHAIARLTASVLALALVPVFLGLIGIGSVVLSRLTSQTGAVEVSALAPLSASGANR